MFITSQFASPVYLLTFLLSTFMFVSAAAVAADPYPLDDRIEPLLDDGLIDRLKGDAKQRMHRPVPREVVLRTDEPWEGNTCGYFTIFRDDEKYRMYYRGSQHGGGKSHRQVVCYAESDDGIDWRKPNLGVVEFNGSKKNNIVWDGIGRHAFVPFKDPNPDAAADAKYKAIGPEYKEGLYIFKSADGIHWQLMRDEPVITKGAFDSQNLAFWDAHEGKYRAYFRDFRDEMRDIRTATSEDFVNWSEPEWLQYPGSEKEQLYTNQIIPHPRAPHLLIGFPTRLLPDRGDLTEGLLMSSRDRVNFHRRPEALVPPGPGAGKWQNRSNYIWHGLVETESHLEGAPPEWSIYVNEGYYKGEDTRIRHYTIRKDGFVSVGAPMGGGELITKTITFDGDRLVLNTATSAAGSVRVEIQTPAGEPIEGFALDDCPPIYGDSLDRVVQWKGGGDVSDLAGQPIRLRLELKDADVFSFRFIPVTLEIYTPDLNFASGKKHEGEWVFPMPVENHWSEALQVTVQPEGGHGAAWQFAGAIGETTLAPGEAKTLEIRARAAHGKARYPLPRVKVDLALENEEANGAQDSTSTTLALPLVGTRPPLKIKPTDAAPTIDGELNEPAWQDTPDVALLGRMDQKRPVKPRTRVWGAYDEDALYLAFHCEEHQMEALKTDAKQRDEAVYSDDSVELMLEPDGDGEGRDYYQIVVNTAGVIFDGQGFNKEVNLPDLRAGASTAGDHWTAEIAIPWNDLGLDGPPQKAGILLGRNRHVGNKHEIFQFPLSPKGNHQPGVFAELDLADQATE
ncbi:MAG: carbohydrate-binding family 9-like protein [Verrucomicrobiota bacterium]